MFLRMAVNTDSPLLYGWRNDPSTRAMMRTTEEISWDEHTQWFLDTLRNPRKHLFLAEVDGVPVGTARLDVAADGSEAEVSVTVAPAHRGRGYGTMILELLSAEAWQNTNLRRLTAYIRNENAASFAAFLKAGYTVEMFDTCANKWMRLARP